MIRSERGVIDVERAVIGERLDTHTREAGGADRGVIGE